MNTYHFSILIRDTDLHDLEDRLYEAGCDDALLCFYNQTPYLEFDREAESAEAAVRSALDNIRAAGFGDLVLQESGVATLAEMAARAGLTRAALSNYATGKRGGGFPAPMYGVGSGSALYSWPEVAGWLHRHGQLSQAQYDIAHVAR